MDTLATDAVQPDQGQGGDQSGTPYAEFLERIPAEVRGDVEPVLRDWDANVTRRFQGQAEFRDRWQPYEQAGIGEYDPSDLAQLVEFAKLVDDPARYDEWLRSEATRKGFIGGDEFGEPSLPDPTLERLLQEQLAPLNESLQQLQGWREKQDMERYQAQARSEIDGYLSDLKERHGDFPADVVEAFAANYVGASPKDAVTRAFADYQRFVAQIEQGVFSRKLEQPNPAETAGGADTAPTVTTSLQEASRIARERLRQQRGA